jgi:hypothetical protein
LLFAIKKVFFVDLGKHIRKSDSVRGRSNYPVERKCMQCGKILDNKGDALYYQRFCSKTCKERYVGMPLD